MAEGKNVIKMLFLYKASPASNCFSFSSRFLSRELLPSNFLIILSRIALLRGSFLSGNCCLAEVARIEIVSQVR